MNQKTPRVRILNDSEGTETALAQAIRTACENGLAIVRTEIHPDGRIILVHLETEPSAVSSTPFDEWKARRDARQS